VSKEILLDLLPRDGAMIPREEAAASLSARLGRRLPLEDFDALARALWPNVVWDDARRRLGRAPDLRNLPAIISRESDLEPWFERYLSRQAVEAFFETRPPSLNIVVQNTARGGGHEGRFTMPDICMACVFRYHYTPGIQLDLYCFELKLGAHFNIPSVMQALSNAAVAHYNYLVVYLREGEATPRYVSAIRTRAVQHGVGIVCIADHLRDDGYQIILPARRLSPLPGDTEIFIEDRFEQANRDALRNWVRS
jgi:hypothetical protein